MNAPTSLAEARFTTVDAPADEVRVVAADTFAITPKVGWHVYAAAHTFIQVKWKGDLMDTVRVIDPEQAWFWTPEWQAGEAEASADIREGRVTEFDSAEDFLASLPD